MSDLRQILTGRADNTVRVRQVENDNPEPKTVRVVHVTNLDRGK